MRDNSAKSYHSPVMQINVVARTHSTGRTETATATRDSSSNSVLVMWILTEICSGLHTRTGDSLILTSKIADFRGETWAAESVALAATRYRARFPFQSGGCGGRQPPTFPFPFLNILADDAFQYL